MTANWLHKRLQQWVERLLGSLLAWAWRKYGQPRLDKAVADNVTVTIDHKQVPVAALAPLADAMPHIINGLKANKTAEEIVGDLKANLGDVVVNTIAGVLSILFPGIGTGVGVIMKIILFMMEHTKPMTQEQENAWFDRFGIGADS